MNPTTILVLITIISLSYGECVGLVKNLGDSCTVEDKCPVGSKCVSGKCTAFNYDTNCMSTTDCVTAGPGLCYNGKCWAKMGPGETCQSNSTCLSGFCDPISKLCSGYAFGAPCDPTKKSSCESGMFCHPNSHKCVQHYSLGSNCSELYSTPVSSFADKSFMCGYGALCDLDTSRGFGTKICIVFGSQKLSESCGNAYSCAQDLSCSTKSGKCEKLAVSIPCNATSDCPSRHICDCGGSKTCIAQVSTDCAAECANLASCMHSTGKCYMAMLAVDLYSPYSCLYERCLSMYEKMVCCYGNGHERTFVMPSHVTCVSTSTPSPTPPPINPLPIEIGITMGVLFLAVVSFGFWRHFKAKSGEMKGFELMRRKEMERRLLD